MVRFDGVLQLPQGFAVEIAAGTTLLAGPAAVLEVHGDSMIEDHIADGDYVLVRRQETANKGQIVVALTDENEATLKRWYPEGDRVRLQPANSSMKPIYSRNARVWGVVVGVVRKLK